MRKTTWARNIQDLTLLLIGHLLDCKKTKWGAGVAYNDSTCLRLSGWGSNLSQQQHFLHVIPIQPEIK